MRQAFPGRSTNSNQLFADQEIASLFAELVSNMDELFWVAEARTWRLLYVSPKYDTLFGRPRSNLEATPTDWASAIHPEDRARISALIQAPSDKPTHCAFRVVHLDGAVRHLRASFFPMCDATGAVIRIGGITRDVTDQLALESQLHQAQKIESLGMLAGGVAHDFNNILAVIASNVGMLSKAASTDDEETVCEIEKAVTRGSSLTRQLLAFSRRQSVRPEAIDLNRVVDDTRKMLRRLVGETIRITTSLDPDLHHVFADPGSMVQVIMNLAVNARDAMPIGGTLAITTRNVQMDGGEHVILEVADTGSGIPLDLQGRIFEPFFTTKAAGKGTGLGLSVVHGIVRQAGGSIDLESTMGRGTTFRIHLPRSTVAAASNELETTSSIVGHERILLVDDDPYVRASAARALRTRGYDLMEANDGEEALRILEREGSTVQLLVTDIVMPHMSGQQLADLARTRQPSLRVLYTTGYTEDAILEGMLDADVALIEKPFRTNDLARRVRQILDAREANAAAST